jgi:hypothetical protein
MTNTRLLCFHQANGKPNNFHANNSCPHQAPLSKANKEVCIEKANQANEDVEY